MVDEQHRFGVAQRLALRGKAGEPGAPGPVDEKVPTQDAIAARGLTLAGWVANRVDPQMLAIDDNIGSLRQRLHAPLLASIPYLPQPDPAQIAIGLPH